MDRKIMETMLMILGILLIILLAVIVWLLGDQAKKLDYIETQTDCYLKALNAIEEVLKEKK